jgi:hypothetical protein
MAINIKSYMADGYDYLFSPHTTVGQGRVPLPQLPRAIMSSKTETVMFMNASKHRVVIAKDQALGRAETVAAGSMVAQVDHIEWDKMIRPGATPVSAGDKPPSVFQMEDYTSDVDACAAEMEVYDARHYEDELRFDHIVREGDRPPRSISEEKVERIAKEVPKRKENERFPVETDSVTGLAGT